MTNHSNRTKHTLGHAGLAALLAIPCVAADECERDDPVKVYLSPSSQSGNIGCHGYVESQGARVIAEAAAGALDARGGYEVRIGSGDAAANAADSNAWGADLHIPIHSNARPGVGSCEEGAPPDHGGTLVMYYPGSDAGQQLAAAILSAVRPLSPGTSDTMRAEAGWIELNSTNAVAAYAEMGFHTHPEDARWLKEQPTAAGEALAAGIAAYCAAVGCRRGLVPIEDGEPELRVLGERQGGAKSGEP